MDFIENGAEEHRVQWEKWQEMGKFFLREGLKELADECQEQGKIEQDLYHLYLEAKESA